MESVQAQMRTYTAHFAVGVRLFTKYMKPIVPVLVVLGAFFAVSLLQSSQSSANATAVGARETQVEEYKIADGPSVDLVFFWFPVVSTAVVYTMYSRHRAEASELERREL